MKYYRILVIGVCILFSIVAVSVISIFVFINIASKPLLIPDSLTPTPTEISTKVIEGRIIGVTPEESKAMYEANKQYGLKENIGNLLVLDEREEIRPKYYLLYDTNEVLNETISEMSQTVNIDNYLGKCIKLNVREIISKNTEDINQYYGNIQLISISDFVVSPDDNCYIDYPSVSNVNMEKPLIDVEAVIKNNPRVAYDISYDYSIEIPYTKAKEIGYSDSSGREDKDMPQTISLPVVPSNSDILKLVETAQQHGQEVKLSGNLQWGYAESMYFYITNVR